VREERWAARTIDIDLLSFDTLEMSGDLELPHPRAHERCFVLVPWEQVAPEQVLPGRGRVADVAVDVKRDGVMWYAPAADLLAGVSP
jgi:7,8-dihydro-6-hydroxymethylpterin-pyrophosphokinase